MLLVPILALVPAAWTPQHECEPTPALAPQAACPGDLSTGTVLLIVVVTLAVIAAILYGLWRWTRGRT